MALNGVISDWSSSGRGSHVDFGLDEIVPLQEGAFLGQGGMAFVYETTVQGHRLAWKKMGFRRKPGVKEKQEIEILKKLSHARMIQLIGTYTHQRILGMLLYPVAVCDLHTFFDDAEAYWNNSPDDSQRHRLDQLGYFPDHVQTLERKAWPIYSQIGCLVSAIAYLHNQSIRHKDLKPSNILLSKGRLYLSDFGNATDFSLLSRSATGDGGGTPMYFAPEVAKHQQSGRATDIFSLGCVLLEVLVFHHEGTLQRLRQTRSSISSAYHANLDKLDTWLPWTARSPRRYHLIWEVRMMLSKNPNQRPSADEILRRINLSDKMMKGTKPSIFGDCCRTLYVDASGRDRNLEEKRIEINYLEDLLHESQDLVKSWRERLEVVEQQFTAALPKQVERRH